MNKINNKIIHYMPFYNYLNFVFKFGELMDMDKDVVKIASKEMLKGSKMLGKHCKCGFPLFEDKNGNIYCPNCNYNKKNNLPKKEEKGEENYSKSLYSNEIMYKKIINKKINYLLKKLDNETEVSRIIEIGTAIELLIKINNDLK